MIKCQYDQGLNCWDNICEVIVDYGKRNGLYFVRTLDVAIVIVYLSDGTSYYPDKYISSFLE